MESKASVVLDMESRELKSMTLAIYRSVMDEPEFRGYPHTGVAIQAYLRETGDDVRLLIDWARTRGQTLTVRLVKGAYWDSEVAWARQQNWPEPVFLHKNESDAAFETIARLILENHEYVHLACGSHNLRSQAFVIETARDLDIPDDRVEFQILHGMAEPVRNALLEEGRRVRMYTPVGEMIPGMAYLVRRLLENTSNESFLRQGFVEKMDPQNLLRPPESSSNERPVESGSSDRFRNEPLLDWTMTANRERFAKVLDDVRARFPVSVPLAIGGERVETGQKIDSRNPNRPDELVGVASSAGAGELGRAVRAASDAYPGWRGTPAADRAEILFAAARGGAAPADGVGGAGGVRDGQRLGRSRWGRVRGHRFSRILRPRNDPPRQTSGSERRSRRDHLVVLRASRRCWRRGALELSDRDFNGYGLGRDRRRKHRRLQTVFGVASLRVCGAGTVR